MALPINTTDNPFSQSMRHERWQAADLVKRAVLFVGLVFGSSAWFALPYLLQ
jgi:hypothetical protein